MADMETLNNRATPTKTSLSLLYRSWFLSLLQDPPGASQSFADALGFWNNRLYSLVIQSSRQRPFSQTPFLDLQKSEACRAGATRQRRTIEQIDDLHEIVISL
jgi:hypothetical protein